MNAEPIKQNTIEVATGEVKVATSPARLQCLALGSCVGVILYDSKNKVGGIAHIMLPSQVSDNKNDVSLKYATNAIPDLIDKLKKIGADSEKLIAYITGGALVIPNSPDVGKENLDVVLDILQKLSIPIVGEYIKGNTGISVLFDLATGELKINGKIIQNNSSPVLSPETTTLLQKSSKQNAQPEKSLALKTEELNKRVIELDNVRKATFNLLEDLEKEREQLSEAKAKDEAMLASIGDGVIIVDPDDRITFMNQTAQNLLGWESQEVTGKSLFDIVPVLDEKGKSVSAPVRSAAVSLATGVATWEEGKERVPSVTKSTPGIYYYVRKNRTKFPVAMNFSRVILDGKVVGAIEVFRDITKEREIDKAKSEFVSLASHQLRTPLTAISWYTEMILKGDVGEVVPGQKKYLEEIYNGNQRMIELVNTLLNVSRIELGTFLFKPQPTNVIELAENVINEQKPKIQSKELTIIQNLDKNTPTFLVDPKLLRMVFQNLLANAVEYTPSGGKIEFTISPDDKKNILVKISDTGYGIPKSQQNKIFSKLFRADNVRNKDTDGTGLGLYIVKSIVENSGGKIRFESIENKGTTFFIEFPIDFKDERKHAINLLN